MTEGLYIRSFFPFPPSVDACLPLELGTPVPVEPAELALELGTPVPVYLVPPPEGREPPSIRREPACQPSHVTSSWPRS